MIYRLLGFSLIGILLAGCSREDVQPSEKSTPVIYTVNYPLAYFAERIAGDRVEVVFPEMAGDPAFWNPSAEEIAAFQEADLILLNGAAYAKWVPKVSLPQSALVDTSAAFPDRYIPLAGALNHTHGPGGEHAHGDIAFTTWLDPQLAILQATAVRDALSRHWKNRSAEFDANFQALEKELLALDAALEKAFAGIGSQPLLGSHPVYQYLARRYTLDMQSVHWEPDSEPDAKMWRELEDILEAHEAKIMLWEDEPLPATKATLQAKGIRSIVFNPCGNRPGDGDYLSIMERNVRQINTKRK